MQCCGTVVFTVVPENYHLSSLEIVVLNCLGRVPSPAGISCGAGTAIFVMDKDPFLVAKNVY